MNTKKKSEGFVGVHIGAGQHSEARTALYLDICSAACQAAIQVLREGGSALDAAEKSTIVLEDAGETNAGYGSNLTESGTLEMDAGLMDGSNLLFGAVGAITEIKNPIRVARKLVDEQARGLLPLGRVPPGFLVGEGARDWAIRHGIHSVSSEKLVSDKAVKLYKHYKKKLDAYKLSIEQQNKRKKEEEENNLESAVCKKFRVAHKLTITEQVRSSDGASKMVDGSSLDLEDNSQANIANRGMVIRPDYGSGICQPLAHSSSVSTGLPYSHHAAQPMGRQMISKPHQYIQLPVSSSCSLLPQSSHVVSLPASHISLANTSNILSQPFASGSQLSSPMINVGMSPSLSSTNSSFSSHQLQRSSSSGVVRLSGVPATHDTSPTTFHNSSLAGQQLVSPLVLPLAADSIRIQPLTTQISSESNPLRVQLILSGDTTTSQSLKPEQIISTNASSNQLTSHSGAYQLIQPPRSDAPITNKFTSSNLSLGNASTTQHIPSFLMSESPGSNSQISQNAHNEKRLQTSHLSRSTNASKSLSLPSNNVYLDGADDHENECDEISDKELTSDNSEFNPKTDEVNTEFPNKSTVTNKEICNEHKKETSDDFDESLDDKVQDTVGVVVLDADGNVAASVSSGGIALKQSGRVGQASCYGCGCWAQRQIKNTNSSVAVSTTGCGEHLVRTLLAKECGQGLANSNNPMDTLQTIMKEKFAESEFLEGISEKLGGAICMQFCKGSGLGSFLWTHTTSSMGIGFQSTGDSAATVKMSRLPKSANVQGTTILVESVSFNTRS